MYVTHHLPWPARSGGRVREAQLLYRLSERFDIEIVAVSKVPELDRSHVGEASRLGVRAQVFAAQPTSASSTSDRHSGPLTRRHASPAARQYLARRLRDPELVVHVEGHYLLTLLPEHAQQAALLVEHNIESQLFHQRAALSRDPDERTTLLQAGTRTRRDELEAWGQVRAVAAVTDEDADLIRTLTPQADVLFLPNGANHLDPSPGQLDAAQVGSPSLLFVAALSYEPNQHAARLLLSDIFPKVLRRCPDVTLAIVGSDPPQWLVEAAHHEPRLTVTGWVPDVAPWLGSAEVVVCPLTVGGGVKVKILEALALGCAIVATPIALQGLRRLPAGTVMERTDPHSFAEACVRLLVSPRERDRQRARAASAARHLPSWDLAARMLGDAWMCLPAATSTTASV